MHKVMSADIFVYLDTVQFSKNGLQNRNQIKTANGPLWLTVPVKHKLGLSIAATEIADSRATEKHWNTLVANYSRTAGFERWRDELRELLTRPRHSLADVAIASTEWILEKLNVNTKRMLASQIPDAQGHSSELIASICKALGATEYLSGTGALAYLDVSNFSAFGCQVLLQQWNPLTYDQKYEKAGFTSDLSTLDLLLNCPDQAAALIAGAGSWRLSLQDND